MKRRLGIAGALVLVLVGCGEPGVGTRRGDARREAELRAKPVRWESVLLVAEPDMPDLKTLVPMEDRFDPTLYQAFAGDTRKTEDYIPESVMAFALPEFENKPRTVTLRIGDTVSVLEFATNNMSLPICLVRTANDTYAWLYAYHIQDENGQRIMSLKEAKPVRR